jgi:tetratricopeptide (TPR) repeat protein
VAYDGMGLAYLKIGKFKETMEAYKKAIDLNPALINSQYRTVSIFLLSIFHQEQKSD